MQADSAAPSLALAVFAACAISCASGPRAESAGSDRGGRAMSFDEAASGSEVRLRSGEEFEIVLGETRTTGYRWDVVDAGVPVCRFLRDSLEAGDPTPGAPGRHTWRIGAAQAGAATIALVYRRPFGGGEPARRFTLRVVVQ